MFATLSGGRLAMEIPWGLPLSRILALFLHADALAALHRATLEGAQGVVAHIPPVLGAVEMRKRRAGPLALALLLKFMPNQGEAWQYTLDELSSFFERALTVFAIRSQSTLGCAFERVKTSTMSPFSNWWSSFTIRPFTFEPTVCKPNLE